MLVFSRARDERVVINLPDGREVYVSVVDIRGPRVRIGLEAPDDITIDREEVAIAKRRGPNAASRRFKAGVPTAPLCEYVPRAGGAR